MDQMSKRFISALNIHNNSKEKKKKKKTNNIKAFNKIIN